MLAARTLAAGGLAAAGAALARRALAAVADEERWTRTNHRGEPVSLLEGPAVGAGLLLGAAVAPGRAAAATVVAAAGGLAFGLVDDLTEDPSTARKGLRGHLGAMAHGELTTGGLKVLGIGATSVAAAAVAIGRPAGSRLAWAADVLGAGALVASTANLVNLLDLRPGRALKAVGLAALTGLGGAGAPAAAAVLGAAAVALRGDLAEQDMLGDGGANALGAALGTAAVLGAPRRVRMLLAGVVALTVASERISFSQVISRTPGLRELDALGRRRAGAT
jgi:UDP-N-acetylmuramyl pentapeptide phosphotransferase/UDP-N-acetylglucosamine-1-phosphate transferase